MLGEVITEEREPEVTFGNFATLARRRGWSKEFMAERFQGRIDEPRKFFEAMWQGQYAATVISFRSVLAFYRQELGLHQLGSGTERRCCCGCGVRVFDRKRFASQACKQRGYRTRQQVAA
jgi:hypothetical protein